jgi:trk system potassium uptake protein TrkA
MPVEMKEMRIIIIGAGEVGAELAAKLSREDNDVTVIDKDMAPLERLESLDVLTVPGNGASLQTLEEAGVKTTDLLIAVTQVDEINIMACLLGKNNGAKSTIARIRQSTYGNEYKSLTSDRLGIDITINPEYVAANEIIKVVKSTHASETEVFCKDKVQMLGMRLGQESPVLSQKLKDLNLGNNTLISAIIRDSKLIIPRGDDTLELGDHVYLLTLTGSRFPYERISGKDSLRVHKVMIMGAGKVGRHVARMLGRSRSMEVKLIDSNLEKCKEAADLFPDIMVLHGDGTDLNFLRQEDIESIDAFIALSGNDEVNILSALLAKELGVKKTVVEINRPDYAVLVDTLNIDTAIRPRLLTAGRILKLVRKGLIESVMILGEDQAEVIEITVAENAPVQGKTLQDLKLPSGILVGAILRNDKAIIPRGSDHIAPKDKVVLFCLPELSQYATTLFSE